MFRGNADDYKMMNLRAKGSVQVFDWLKIENNMDFSNMDYHNPINVGEGGSIWRNISDHGHHTSPIFNPDGSLTFWQLSLQADYDSFEGWTKPVKVAQAEVTPVRLVPTENGWRVDKLELPL